MRETEGAILFALLRRHILGDRKISPGGLQILSDRRHIDILLAQIAEQLLYFAISLAKSHHGSRLGHYAWAVPARESKHLQRLAVVRLRAHAPVATPHSLHIVIENIRCQNFDPSPWQHPS